MNTHIQKTLLSVAIATSLSACNLTLSINGEGQVKSNDGNIDCPQQCTHNYATPGNTVFLTATPDEGHQFVGFTVFINLLIGLSRFMKTV